MRPVVVAGLGPSVEGFLPPKGVEVWGVNDIGRYLAPDCLVVLDGPDRFKDHPRRPDALVQILNTAAPYVFISRKKAWSSPTDMRVVWKGSGPSTPAYWGVWPSSSEVIKVDLHPLGKALPIDFNSSSVPIAHTSVLAAAFIAIRSRAPHRLGLIGVDLVDHPDLNGLEGELDYQFQRLAEAAKKHYGTEVVNLSPDSRLTSLPKVTLDEFTG